MNDLEQVAIHLLRDSHPGHPLLYVWVDAILADPQEQRGLDEFPVPAEYMLDLARPDNSYRPPEPGRSLEDMFDGRAGCRAVNELRRRSRRLARAYRDSAIAMLAGSIVLYRKYGQKLDRDGEPVDTFLDGGILEYVRRLEQAYGNQINELENGEEPDIDDR